MNGETLKRLEKIHSKFNIGVGLVAATKVTKALGGSILRC